MPRMTSSHGAITGLCTLALLLGGCAAAKPAQRVDAPPNAVGAVEPAAPVTQVLPNVLRLIMQDHRAGNIVAIYLWIGVGARYDGPGELGYAHFMEHMLFKGTDRWGPGHVDRAVEGIGG